MPASGIIYARLSRDKKDQTSIADQVSYCTTRLNGLGVPSERITVFTEDPGTSGYKEDVELPERGKFLAALAPNNVAATWRFDRLSRRDIDDWGAIKRLLKKSGCRYVTVADGIDTDLQGWEFNAGIQAMMAHNYSETISVNVKRGKATGAKNGKWNGGQRWYGYSPDPDGVWRGPKVIDVTESKILRDIRDRYVSGERPIRIATDLNARGITTVQGALWRDTNILRLIINPRYAGIRVHRGARHKGNWPAIFTEAEHLEVMAYRNSEKQMRHWPKGPTGTRSALLTGFVYCVCGAKMISKRRASGSSRARRYACLSKDGRGQPMGCGKVVRVAEPLETLVVEELLDKLDTPGLAAMLAPADNKAELDGLIATQDTLKNRLDELHRDYYGETDDGLRIDRATFMQQKDLLEHRLKEVQGKIAALLNSRAPIQLELGHTLIEAWERGSLDWRRRLLSLVLDKVIVYPCHPGSATWRGWRFVPDSVERVWKC